MKRQVFVVCMLTAILLWGGSAFGQTFGAKMDASAVNECTGAESLEPVSMFPYFARADGNWNNGIYLVNTSGTDLPENALCFVGIDNEGNDFATFSSELKGDGGSQLFLKQDLGQSWLGELYMGIYARNAEVLETARSLVAFGSISHKGQGGAYGTSFVNQEPGTKLKFDFLPGGGNWWGAMVFWNTSNANAQLEFTYFKDDDKAVDPLKKTVPAGDFIKLQAADFTWWDAPVTVIVESTQPLYGYAQYGNFRSTNGYFPEYID